MAKIVTAGELGELVSKVLKGEVPLAGGDATFAAVTNDVAEVLCRHFGGYVSSVASKDEFEDWVVGFRMDGVAPEEGIWSLVDPEGSMAVDGALQVGPGDVLLGRRFAGGERMLLGLLEVRYQDKVWAEDGHLPTKAEAKGIAEELRDRVLSRAGGRAEEWEVTCSVVGRLPGRWAVECAIPDRHVTCDADWAVMLSHLYGEDAGVVTSGLNATVGLSVSGMWADDLTVEVLTVDARSAAGVMMVALLRSLESGEVDDEQAHVAKRRCEAWLESQDRLLG